MTACLLDTASVHLSQDGSGNLLADVKASADNRNGVTIVSDGVLARDFRFVTAIPASAVEGDKIVLVHAGDGIAWPMIYSGTLAVWVPCGTSMGQFDETNTLGTISPTGGSAWFDLSGTDVIGPKVTIRWAGSYIVHWAASIGAWANGQAARMGISISGADPTSDNFISTTNDFVSEVASFRKLTGLAVGNYLQGMYNSDGSAGGANAQYSRRRMIVQPFQLHL